jgi:hypothetical protein
MRSVRFIVVIGVSLTAGSCDRPTTSSRGDVGAPGPLGPMGDGFIPANAFRIRGSGPESRSAASACAQKRKPWF